MNTQAVPQRLQSLFWSAHIKQLDIDRDKPYIIHQVLSHGNLEDIRWLLNTYTKQTVLDVFRHTPYKAYEAARYHFIVRTILQRDQNEFLTSNYVQDSPLNLR